MPPMGIMPAATWGSIAHVKLDFCDLLHVCREPLFFSSANGRCWPRTDVARCLLLGRYRRQNGHAADIAEGPNLTHLRYLRGCDGP
jgi:hypothetical protein